MKKIAFVLFLVGIGAAMLVLSERSRIEQQSKVVSIALDYDEVDRIATAGGKSIVKVLKVFKAAGANAVAIQEETIGDLVDNGAAVFSVDNTGYPTLRVLDKNWEAGVRKRLKAAFGVQRRDFDGMAVETSSGKIYISARRQHVRLIPAGMNPAAVARVKSAGMQVIARMVDYPVVNKRYIRLAMSDVKAEGARTVIFAGDQVLGFRNLVNETGRIMRQYGLKYGSIEFSKQKGDTNLSASDQKLLVRVHSITIPEMVIIDRSLAIERYARAVRERGIKLCYVRMLDFNSPNVVNYNSNYIRQIASKIHSQGMVIGEAQPIGDPKIPAWLLGLAGVGSAGLFMLLMTSWFTLSRSAMYAWLVFSVSAGIAAGISGQPILHKILALGTAIIAPLYGLTLAASERKKIGDSINSTVVIWAVVLSIGVIGITAFGGMLTAAFISSRPFLMKTDQFAGVKLAHLIPIVTGAFAIASGIIWNPGCLKEQKERVAKNLEYLFKKPILVWQAVAAFVILGAIAVLISRSGNETSVGVSPIELKIRAMLDSLLYVRPRTKEFLAGHPALYLGIASMLMGKKSWASPLLIVGVIGLVSVVNTFCHSHTPIALSIARVVVGTVVGLTIGIIILLTAKRYSGGKTK